MRCLALLLCCVSLLSNAHAIFFAADPPEHLGGDPSDGDHCPPMIIAALPVTITGNTTNSVLDVYVQCTNSSLDDIYAISLDCETDVTLSFCNLNTVFDVSVEIRRGPNSAYDECPGSIVVACVDNSCGFLAQTSFTIPAGDTYFIIVGGNSVWDSGPYEMVVTGAPCAAPPPVTDLVTQLGPNPGDMTLRWSAVPGADVYRIFRADNSETIFDSDNLIATAVNATYTCTGCLDEPVSRSFFGVIAESQP